MFYKFPFSFPLSSSYFWVTMEAVMLNSHIFSYKPGVQHLSKIFSKERWFSKIMALLNIIKWLHIIFCMWRIRFCDQNKNYGHHSFKKARWKLQITTLTKFDSIREYVRHHINLLSFIINTSSYSSTKMHLLPLLHHFCCHHFISGRHLDAASASNFSTCFVV